MQKQFGYDSAALGIVVVVVVVAFSSRVRILGECWTVHSPPALIIIYLSI